MGITKHVFEDFRAIPILGDIAPRAILCSLALCCFSLFSNYCQPSNLTACLFTCLPICLPACLSVYFLACPFALPSACDSCACMLACISAWLPVYLFDCLHACRATGHTDWFTNLRSLGVLKCDILCSLPTDIEDPFQVFFSLRSSWLVK